MTEQVSGRRGAEGRGSGVEFEVLRFQHGASGDTAYADPPEERQHQHDLPDGLGGLEHLKHHDGAEQHGQREEDVGDTAQHCINPAAEEAGDGADQGTDDHDQQRGEHADGQRGARAVDHAGVHVAALQVEAEGVAGGGGAQGVAQIASVRVLLGEQPGGDGHHDDEENQQPGDDEQRVAAQGAPCVGPHAGGRSRFVDGIDVLQRGLLDWSYVAVLTRQGFHEVFGSRFAGLVEFVLSGFVCHYRSLLPAHA